MVVKEKEENATAVTFPSNMIRSNRAPPRLIFAGNSFDYQRHLQISVQALRYCTKRETEI